MPEPRRGEVSGGFILIVSPTREVLAERIDAVEDVVNRQAPCGHQVAFLQVTVVDCTGERWELAESRGATMYGEVIGRGSSVALTRGSQPRPQVAIANALRLLMSLMNLYLPGMMYL